jgi:hypothetical protein
VGKLLENGLANTLSKEASEEIGWHTSEQSTSSSESEELDALLDATNVESVAALQRGLLQPVENVSIAAATSQGAEPPPSQQAETEKREGTAGVTSTEILRTERRTQPTPEQFIRHTDVSPRLRIATHA